MSTFCLFFVYFCLIFVYFFVYFWSTFCIFFVYFCLIFVYFFVYFWSTFWLFFGYFCLIFVYFFVYSWSTFWLFFVYFCLIFVYFFVYFLAIFPILFCLLCFLFFFSKPIIFLFSAVRGDIFEYCVGKAPFNESDAREITRQLTHALEFIHSKHIVHMDIKPQNILLSNDGKCRLADFGLSRKIPPGESVQEISGTPEYTGKST